MIKKMRRRFVLVTMITLLVIFFSIWSYLNCSDYARAYHVSNTFLDVLEENGGDLPSPGEPLFRNDQNSKRSRLFPDMPFEITSEAIQTLRCFTLNVNDTGEIIFMNASHMRSFTSGQAAYFAGKALKSQKSSGRTGDFSYRICPAPEGKLLLFVDTSLFYDLSHAILFISSLSCLLILSFLFLVVFISSKIAVKPIAESYARQNQFITDAGHELKTPLTIIDANAEILEMDMGENDCVEEITNQTKRMAQLTQQLIYMAKMTEGTYSPMKIDFLFSDMAADVAQEFSAKFTKAQKTLSAEITPLLTINGSENELRHVVSILLDNAIKYSSSGDNVVLTVCQSGSKNLLSVANHTDNMSPVTVSHMFDRFYRGESSHNSETGGHGLGLSIAKDIVEGNGGKISAQLKNGIITLTAVFPAVEMK